jgi:hypothetical protein
MITYKLELRVSLDTPEQEQAMVESIKMGAKHMFTTASLISTQRRLRYPPSHHQIRRPTTWRHRNKLPPK